MSVLAGEARLELAEFDFDITDSQGLRAIDRAHKRMVRRARLRKGTTSIGPTVAGQQDYSLAGHGVVSVLDLTVGGVPYDRAPRRAQVAYARGQLTWWPSQNGLFVETADDLETPQLGLIPPPSVGGLPIIVYGDIEASTVGDTDPLLVPDEYVDRLVDYAAATFYRREPAQVALAQSLEQAFDAACEELRRQQAKIARGSGPARIRAQRA